MYFLSLLIIISDALTTDNSTMSFFLFSITFNLAETIGNCAENKTIFRSHCQPADILQRRLPLL